MTQSIVVIRANETQYLEVSLSESELEEAVERFFMNCPLTLPESGRTLGDAFAYATAEHEEIFSEPAPDDALTFVEFLEDEGKLLHEVAVHQVVQLV